MSNEYEDPRFHGYPPEQAIELFKSQLHAIECLCHLGSIWRTQWQIEPREIPMEADIHGT